MRSGEPELLERDQELAEIASAVESARDGNGRVVVVEGAPGLGKRALLRAARASAAASGFVTLTATGAEFEQGFPFGIVRQLFERTVAAAGPEEQAWLLSGAAARARIVLTAAPGVEQGAEPEAGGSTSAEASPPSSEDRSFALVHGLYWLCANIAGRGPTLLTVHDAHWADPASLRFLLYLARRIEELPVVLLLSMSPEEKPAHSLVELRGLPMAKVVRSRPFSEQAVARVVRARLGDHAEDAFCAACHASTGGNPFLLRELVRLLEDEGTEPTAGAATLVADMGPDSVARTVSARIERLSPAALPLARTAAVLGPGSLLRHAAALASLDLGPAGETADRLAAAGILRPGRPLEFVHPIVRAAVYNAIPPAERSDTHRRAARILAQEGASSDPVASHLLACEPAADAWAAEVLREAGRRALRRGAPDIAVRYFHRALDEPPPRGSLAALAHEAGVAELRIDPSAATVHLRRAIELAQVPVERGRIALDLLHASLWTDRVGEAVRVAQDTADALGQGDQELLLELEAEMITALRTGVATSPLADARLDRWRGRAEGRTPAERLLLVHLAVRTGVRGGDADAVAALAERALAGGRLLAEQSAESIVPYLPLYQLISADRHLDLVDRCLTEAVARARGSGSLLALAYASLFRGELERVRGDLADAEADALQALDAMAGVVAWRFPTAGIVGGVVSVLVERGKLDEAERAIADYGLTGELDDSVTSRVLLERRGHLRMAQGRTKEGLTDLLELMAREERTGATNLFLTPYRSLAAVALTRLGERDRAVALAEDALVGARAWGAAPALGTALCHAGLARGGPAGLQLLREATEILEGSSARLAHASALVELGSALRRSGRRADSLDPLRSGLDIAHRCGAHPLEARARQELVQAGARPRRPAQSGAEALTPSERRVCRLAAQGMTNRDIAQALFVTLRTVEIHLTHAYQKLQITSRKALTERLLGPWE